MPMQQRAPDDFTSLYTGHFHRVAIQLYAYLGDHAEAQDLTQEAFTRALVRWPSNRQSCQDRSLRPSGLSLL